MLEWSWPAMSWNNAEFIDGWLKILNGQIGSFTFAPRQPYNFTTTGLTLATIGYNYNGTISVKGWAANAGTGLRKGQYFQIGTQLLQVTEAAAFTDANGAATISFAPELRQQYAVGTIVNFVNPVGVFGLTSSEGQSYTLTRDQACEFGPVQAREVV